MIAGLVPLLGFLYLHFVGKTSRLRVHRHPSVEKIFRDGSPCIFAFWHRHQLMMCYEHRNRGVTGLVSRSKDGELIARALRLFGYKTVRGSSTRGGAAALMELLKTLKRGERVAVTPDGPKGPFRSIQPGVLALAQKSGAPIVPCGWAGTRVMSLSSWDRFMVPLPFGRYDVVFAAPLFLTGDDPAVAEKVRCALDAAAEGAAQKLLC